MDGGILSVREQAGLVSLSPRAAGQRNVTLLQPNLCSETSDDEEDVGTLASSRREPLPAAATRQPIAEAGEGWNQARSRVSTAAPAGSEPSKAALLFSLAAEQAKQQSSEGSQQVGCVLALWCREEWGGG